MAKKNVQPIDSLKAQMSAIATATAPSMVPDFTPAPPPPKEEEVVPELKHLITEKKDFLEIKRLVATSLEWAAKEAEAKRARDPITNKLKALLGKYKVGKAQLEDTRINYFGSERHTIKDTLLLAHNISPKIIQECTETKTVYTLKITRESEEDE